MARDEWLFRGRDVDFSRVGRVLEEELRSFAAHIGKWPVTEAQDLPALLIAWVATFMPEAVPGSFTRRLEEIVLEARRREDFSWRVWWVMLPLDVALFALTGVHQWLDICRLNLDNISIDLHPYLLESLALIVDRLDFGDEELQTRTTRNLKKPQLNSEWCAVMLLMARGDPEEKLRRLRDWLADPELALFPSQRRVLEALEKGLSVENTFFLPQFLWIMRYGWLRFTLRHTPKDVQMVLPVCENEKEQGGEQARERQGELFPAPKAPPLAELVWQRMWGHPLMGSSICLRNAGDDG